MALMVSPEIEAEIERLLADGRYPSEEAVLTEALALLSARDRQVAELRAKVQIAVDEIERGEGIRVEPGFWAEIQQEARAMRERGERPDPDVCP